MLKNLTPQILKTLDGWLLKNWPLVWRTRIHWVLLFSLVGHLLVGFGFLLFPLSISDLPSRDSLEFVNELLLAFAGISMLIWGYFTIRIPIRSFRLKDLLFTSFIYCLGVVIVGTNIWIPKKNYAHKTASLISEERFQMGYEQYLSDEIPLLQQKEYLLKTYEVIPNHFDFDGYQDITEVDAALLQTYGKSLKTLMGTASERRGLIYDARMNKSWFSIGNDPVYRDLFLGVILFLILVPLLFMFWSISSLKEILITAFAMFISLIGVRLLSGFFYFPGSYLVFAFPAFLLVYLIRHNRTRSNWLIIYGTALLVWIVVPDIDFLNPEYLSTIKNFLVYESYEFYASLMSTLFAGIGAYLYQRKLKNPQTE